MRNFRCARGGNVALIFAASAVPLIMGVGAAVDYSRANSMKAAMQTAIDSTGLTLGRKYSTLSASQLQNQASLIFASLFTRPEAKNPTITAVENASAGTIQVNATASMDTAFVGILGLKSIQVDVTATTSLAASSSLRVALVLDNTGSMAQSGKMPALQTAAKNLIARIQSAATTNGLAYVSIVPFVKDVNLGSSNYNQSWLQWDDGTDNSWDGSKGTCSNSNYSPRSQCLAQGTCSISGNNTQSSCTAAANCSISGYSTRAPARPLLFAQIPAKRPRAPAPAPRPAPTSFTRRKASARFITTLGVTGPGATASGLPASGRRNIPGPPPATAHGPAASLIAATAVVRVPAITTPTTFCRRPAPRRPSMSPSNTLLVRKRP